LTRGYDIYKKLKFDYFTWVGNEPTRSGALQRLESLTLEKRDDSTYVAVAKAFPSLLAISPAVAGSSGARY
jgi:hypothetical protein